MSDERTLASMAARIVLADMVRVRAALIAEMPGKMDALADKIDDWSKGVAMTVRELERPK